MNENSTSQDLIISINQLIDAAARSDDEQFRSEMSELITKFQYLTINDFSVENDSMIVEMNRSLNGYIARNT